MHTNSAKIEEKRTESMVAVFLLLVKMGYIDGSKFTLNRSILKTAVKHYLQDLQALKTRYGITDKAQPQKVAGLTAAAIEKFKPVLPRNGSDETLQESEANEMLSVFHGLCICAEQHDGKIDMRVLKELYENPEFPEWLSNFRYLLKFRNYTAENLAMVFDTLVRFAR